MALPNDLNRVASALYRFLDTPLSLSCEILRRHGEWDQLVSISVDPSNYLEGPWGAEAYRRDAQAAAFLRKSPLVATQVDRVAAAVALFWDSENRCHETNLRLKLLEYPSRHESVAEAALRDILRRARKNARRILGPVPNSLELGFGPGTSFELKGRTFSTLADKLWITPHATAACMPLFEHVFWPSLWGRERLAAGLPLPAQCRGNRFTTVPKDATKDRGICVEPLGNLAVQLGIGRYWKRRLGLVGLHTASNHVFAEHSSLWRTPKARFDGQTIHRNVARKGSLDGTWATIDLSNASDTVAFELVRWVLPSDWFDVLCAARSPLTLIEGQWVHLDKFSSMGNGFTFELETLIFAAILAAGLGLSIGDDLLVYGDDILLPNNLAVDAMAILTACGFQPNMKKSFHRGPFRESCGGDFHSGLAVRPYYANGSFESPLEWVAMHNRLRSLWPGLPGYVLRRCVEAVPLKLRVFGPSLLGDRVFHGRPERFWDKDGIRWVATIVPMPLRVPLDRWSDELHLALAVLGVPSEGICPRGSVRGYRIERASVS